MFKRLRERIAEETTKLPGGQANIPKQSSESTSKSSHASSNEDLITLNENSSSVVQSNFQQFSIGDDDEASPSDSPQKKQNDVANDSQTANHNSRDGHSLFGSDLGYVQEYKPTKSNYIPQSDIESEREDPPTLNLEGISKDQLLAVIDMHKAKTYKYKNKYAEVVKNYKVLRDEKLKIEHLLIEHQDKGLRRIAELREQCQLEQKAKAHLEAELRLLLEEKDSRISVLETQNNLLKETDKSQSLLVDVSNRSQNNSESKEKVERLEHLLTQAKKTLASQKDQIGQLKKQNETMATEVEEKVKLLKEMEKKQSSMQSDHEAVLASLQARLRELESQQEESAMSMAETKKCMHEELELKEKQLVKAQEEAKHFQKEFESEKSKSIELEKQCDEKVATLQRQLESTEKTLEDEKQNLMQELARGKTAAITLVQEGLKQDLLKQVSAVEAEWKAKLKEAQSKVTELPEKLKESERKLSKSESQVQELKSIIVQLNKENEYLKSSVGQKDSEKLKSKCASLATELSAERSLVESQQSKTKKETSHLEDQLVVMREKLSECEKDRQNLETKVSQLQEENSLLLGKSNHFESLKAEKEELNEKLKQVEHQVTSTKDLENEKDTLKSENAAILNKLELLESSHQSESADLKQKIASLEEARTKLQDEIQQLSESNKKLEESFESEKKLLISEKEALSQKIQLLENADSADGAVKDYVAVLKAEFDNKIKEKEEEMDTKLKLLVKDFSEQMDVKDRDCDKIVSETIGKSQDVESKLLRDHRLQMAEIRQDLFQQECAIEEMRDSYEERLKEKEKKITELKSTIKKLSETSNEDAAPAIAEGSDWDDAWVVPDECVENTSPFHTSDSCKDHVKEIESLKEELAKSNSEIKELKILLRLSPPETMVENNNRRDSLQSVPEPTEFEYLKNIIYEYMMGKEPITLVKVIAAVLRFSDQQTQQVVRREETKHTTR